ncbi:tyrosine-protein phosphatase 10D-like [Cydia amplana]|uniref:tyrosine-protein phosphatase 10D-like n=1 Tax=Cydia amplana TaxID=1869771 RepID=UPI002FE63315
MRLSCGCVGCEEEKVSRETFEPSMMWMRSFAQATAERGRAVPARARLLRALPPPLLLLALLLLVGGTWGADLVIEIPGSGAGAADPGGEYRLDYRPPHGSPAPNFTVPARASTINFQGLPGTKYHFMLYYSNATFADLLTWNQTIITAPEPPTNLTVSLSRNKQATIAWAPPSHGEYTGFRFKVIPLTERTEGGARNITVEAPETPGAGWTHTLKELSPGATYQLHAFTLLHDKESAAYASRNFTTSDAATRPLAPVVRTWGGAARQLSLAWSSDVNSRQDHYELRHRRRPEPGAALDDPEYTFKTITTTDTNATLSGLFPGAVYEVTVAAVSHGLRSERHTVFKPVRPLPPTWMGVERATSNSVVVRWRGPGSGSKLGAFLLQYRTHSEQKWTKLPPLQPDINEAEVVDMTHGERYTIQLDTLSEAVAGDSVDSGEPREADHTVRPNPVSNVAALVDTRNMTLEWPVPAGRVERYGLRWWPRPDEVPDAVPAARNLTAEPGVKTVRALLDALEPGVGYTLTVHAVSYNLTSDLFTMETRTRPLIQSEMTIVNEPEAEVGNDTLPAIRVLYTLTPATASRFDSYRFRLEGGPGEAQEQTRSATAPAARVEFARLVPGRLYNVTMWTVSGNVTSHPVQRPVRYIQEQTAPAARVEFARLVPGRLYNVTMWTVSGNVTPRAAPGTLHTGADRARRARRRPVRYIQEQTAPAARVEFARLVPGRLYNVTMWTVSGNVTSHPVQRPVRYIQEQTARVEFARLVPGRLYNVTMWTVSGNVTSHPVQRPVRYIQEQTARVEFARLVPGRLYNVTMWTVSGNVTSHPVQRPVRYIQEQTARQTAPAARVEFARLVPGRLYNVTMWTVSGNVTSHPVQRPTRLYPRPVAYLKQLALGARNVTLAWPEPAGDYTDFELQYLTAEDTLEARSTTGTEYTVQDLQPHTNYVFTIEVRSGTPATLMTRSAGLSVQLATRQAAPPAPRSFHPTDAKPSQLTFAWDLPANQANGVLEKFVIEYAPQNQPEKNTTITFPPEARSGVVAGLTPGGTYSFRLWAATGAGSGPAARWTQHLAIAAPPRPAPHQLPAAVRATPTTVSVRFRNDFFSSANGNVSAYALVVAQEPRNDSSDRLPSWRDVHALPVWPPYQVTEPYFPFHHSSVEEYTIGSERCESSGRAYCNGPLRPGAAYYVKLRAYTAPDKFTDTAYAVVYTGHSVEEYTIGSERCESSGRAYCNGPLRPGAAYYVKLRAYTAPDKFTDTAYAVVYTGHSVEEYTIGSERCESSGRAYCNGPLRPGAAYYVKLRAYTAPDKFTDTAYAVVYTGHSVEEYTIGSERCESSGRAYCNGPLRPGAAYYVKLRAYTAPDKFTDTAYAVVYTGHSVEEYTIGSERCESSGRAYCNGPLRPGAAYYVKLRAYTAPDKFTDTAYAVVYTGHSVEEYTIGSERCESSGRAYCNGPLRPGAAYYVKLRAYTAPDNITYDCTFHHSSVEEYTIGSERCESSGRAYCNGPLRPGAAYYVKLRAYTAPDKFTDTAYAVVYTEVDNTAWIIGVCAGAACVAAAGAAWAALRRRRPRAAPAAPAPAPRVCRPVPVADFVDHYRLMSADSDFRFSEEFEELKHVGREQPCTAADLPVNRPKNRFTNILPYDHSRYKLQPVDDEEGSDYINANYVPGHSSPREFIVTQGPLHCTRDDFWRMVWESGSRAIVMLTRCVEKGREKCDRYWPYDTRPVYYGDIAVTALNESRFPDWTITELLASRGAEQRVVKHFHFTTWPDFGVPDPPTTLARFVRAFRERCPPDARPVVVHCSAGVGRSGTFITLDRALQQLAARADTLDIFGMVYAMRRERVWMVQTEQQYICIHQCVVAALEGADLQPPLGLNHHMHHNQAFEDDEGIAESGM